VCLASAVLLCAFGIAMSVSLGFSSQFPFAVPVWPAGPFFLLLRQGSKNGLTVHFMQNDKLDG